MKLADNAMFSARVNKSDGREMPGPATLRNKAPASFEGHHIRHLCTPNDHASLFAPRLGPSTDIRLIPGDESHRPHAPPA
ncbi:hypothetical protein ROSA5918_20655 [Roseateles saccharophilus]|uniref:Uncharacterized protein n=1 Tax=Roseateles saccharophilus TaxID=304 RepID=A0A4R3UJ81_ROSSA|nr:hypothetical protein EV671_103441 [Roseateles saccharophilus]